jgi:hypothetical protein
MKTTRLDGSGKCVLEGCGKKAKYRLPINMQSKKKIDFCKHHFEKTREYNLEQLIKGNRGLLKKMSKFLDEWSLDQEDRKELYIELMATLIDGMKELPIEKKVK